MAFKKIQIKSGESTPFESVVDVAIKDSKGRKIIDTYEVADNTILKQSNVVNTTSSTSTINPLSANMGKELQDQINNLKSRGRYLSTWNCSTGLAGTTPTTLPYTYKTGDYFIVSTLASGSASNYKPDGITYTAIASTTVETGTVKVNDTYYYDGSTWTLLHGEETEVVWGSIGGNLDDQEDLWNILGELQQIDCNGLTLEYGTSNSQTISLQELDKTKSMVLYNMYYVPNWNKDIIDYTDTTFQSLIYYKNGHFYQKIKCCNYKNNSVTVTAINVGETAYTPFADKVGTVLSQNSESVWEADLGTTRPSGGFDTTLTFGISWSTSETGTRTATVNGANKDFNFVSNPIQINKSSTAYDTYISIPGSTDYATITITPGASSMSVSGVLTDTSSGDGTRIDMSRFTFELKTKQSTSELGLRIATALNNASKTKPIELCDFRLLSMSEGANNYCLLNRNGNDNIFEGYVVQDNETYTLHIEIDPTTSPYLTYYLYPTKNLKIYDTNVLSKVYLDDCGKSPIHTFEYTKDTDELTTGYTEGLIPDTKGKTGTYSYSRIKFYVATDGGTLTINYYQSGLNHNHYCCFSNLDTELATGYGDVSTNVKTTTVDVSGTGSVQYTGISAGMHYITIKFRKNTYAVVDPDLFFIYNITCTNSEKMILPYESTMVTTLELSNPTGTGYLSLNRLSGSTIGDYSVATGFNTSANGDYSRSGGYQTNALGSYSHSEGYGTINAVTVSSISGSTLTMKYSDHGVITGDILRHTENGVYVYYQVSNRNGYYVTLATSIGVSNTSNWYLIRGIASGIAAHTEGANNTSSGAGSHVEGGVQEVNKNVWLYPDLSSYTSSKTNFTISSYEAYPEQLKALVSGMTINGSFYYVTEEGEETTTTVNRTLTSCTYDENTDILNFTVNSSFGASKTNLEDISFGIKDVGAILLNKGTNIAIGTSSHAEGVNTQSYGYASHAEGIQTSAIGECSHSEGYCQPHTYSIAVSSISSSSQLVLSSGSSYVTTGDVLTHVNSSGIEEFYLVYKKEELNVYITPTLTDLQDTSNWSRITRVAYGYASHTEGYNTSANGLYSHAEGYQTIASVNGIDTLGNPQKSASHAEGYETNAIGSYGSHAEGHQTNALGGSSHTEGYYTTASGSYSHAEGSHTGASGSESHAEGYETIATATAAHAEGSGHNCSSSIRVSSISSKVLTMSSSDHGIVAGDCLRVYALSRFNYYTVTAVSGTQVTLSQTPVATATASWDKITGGIASGYASHSEGYGTIASGSESHAEGYYTKASGQQSHVEGNYTIASCKSQHVFGEYNILDETGTTYERGTYVEIVGNGTSSARSNARTLDWSGNEVLAGKLTVGAAPTNNMDVTTKQYVDALQHITAEDVTIG